MFNLVRSAWFARTTGRSSSKGKTSCRNSAQAQSSVARRKRKPGIRCFETVFLRHWLVFFFQETFQPGLIFVGKASLPSQYNTFRLLSLERLTSHSQMLDFPRSLMYCRRLEPNWVEPLSCALFSSITWKCSTRLKEYRWRRKKSFFLTLTTGGRSMASTRNGTIRTTNLGKDPFQIFPQWNSEL